LSSPEESRHYSFSPDSVEAFLIFFAEPFLVLHCASGWRLTFGRSFAPPTLSQSLCSHPYAAGTTSYAAVPFGQSGPYALREPSPAGVSFFLLPCWALARLSGSQNFLGGLHLRPFLKIYWLFSPGRASFRSLSMTFRTCFFSPSLLFSLIRVWAIPGLDASGITERLPSQRLVSALLSRPASLTRSSVGGPPPPPPLMKSCQSE